MYKRVTCVCITGRKRLWDLLWSSDYWPRSLQSWRNTPTLSGAFLLLTPNLTSWWNNHQPDGWRWMHLYWDRGPMGIFWEGGVSFWQKLSWPVNILLSSSCYSWFIRAELRCLFPLGLFLSFFFKLSHVFNLVILLKKTAKHVINHVVDVT